MYSGSVLAWFEGVDR